MEQNNAVTEAEIDEGAAVVNKIDNEHIDDQMMVVKEVKQVELVKSSERQTLVDMDSGARFTMGEVLEKINSGSFELQEF